MKSCTIIVLFEDTVALIAWTDDYVPDDGVDSPTTRNDVPLGGSNNPIGSWTITYVPIYKLEAEVKLIYSRVLSWTVVTRG